jgi:hypothetical protein
MNPYLNDLGTPAEPQRANGAVDSDQANGFSPGYKPHKDATVRSVKPGSRDAHNTPPASRSEQVKARQSLSTESPKLKLKMKHGRTSIARPNDDSFLADNSSCNEDRSGRVTPSGDKSTAGGMDETRKVSTSPTAPTFSSPALESKSDRKANTGEKRNLLGPAGASASQSASDVEDEGWVLTSPSQQEQTTIKKKAGKSKRVWLEPTSSEENLSDAKHMVLPLEGARTSPKSVEKASPTSAQATTPSSVEDVFHSATSLPVVQIENRDSDNMPAIVESRASTDVDPTETDRERAMTIFGGEQPSSQKALAAAVLGDVSLASTRIRKAYMDLFDWSGFNILAAMRDLCGKLVLKAETQQVDRILMSLSERWCACNPNHGFKAIGKIVRRLHQLLCANAKRRRRPHHLLLHLASQH